MATSASKTFSGDICMDGFVSSCGNTADYTKPSSVFFGEHTSRSFHKASLRLRRWEPSNARLVCGYSIYDVMWRNGCSIPFTGSRPRNLQVVASAQYSGGAAQDVSFEGSSHDDLPPGSVGQYVFSHGAWSLIYGFTVIYSLDSMHTFLIAPFCFHSLTVPIVLLLGLFIYLDVHCRIYM